MSAAAVAQPPVGADPVRDAINLAKDLDGRELLYPDDEWLPEPEIYYNPQAPNLRFKVYRDPKYTTDPRTQLRFQPEQFIHGRYIAHTKVTRDGVRRVLGAAADRWKGDNARRQYRCPSPSCDFATRNDEAWEDHAHYTDHFRVG